jgi:HupE / UreJ protein
METFNFFFSEGWRHISDITAYDHILFVVSLMSIYALRQFKTIFWLVTAFTLGHSVALALSIYDIVRIQTELVEFLIPVTIFINCALNIYTAKPALAENKPETVSLGFKYALAASFGLIHGLGFSNYLRFILTEQDSLAIPLLGFNVGLEIGQLLIVAVALFANFLFVERLKANLRDWTLVVSGAVAGIALVLCIETGHAYFFPSPH